MIKWYNSKTLWFNVAMTILLSAPVIAVSYKAMAPEQAIFVDAILGLITGLGNIIVKVWFEGAPIDTPKARAAQAAQAFARPWDATR